MKYLNEIYVSFCVLYSIYNGKSISIYFFRNRLFFIFGILYNII